MDQLEEQPGSGLERIQQALHRQRNDLEGTVVARISCTNDGGADNRAGWPKSDFNANIDWSNNRISYIQFRHYDDAGE